MIRFLGAPKHLYNWLCPSVSWSVGLLVSYTFVQRFTRRTLLAYLGMLDVPLHSCQRLCPSVGPHIGPSVRLVHPWPFLCVCVINHAISLLCVCVSVCLSVYLSVCLYVELFCSTIFSSFLIILFLFFPLAFLFGQRPRRGR